MIFSKKKYFFLFNFHFEINVEAIEIITKNIKKKISSPLGVLKIVFLIKNSHIIPVQSSQKKMEKNSKKRFLGSMSRS